MSKILTSPYLVSPPNRSQFAGGQGHSIYLADKEPSIVLATGDNTYGQIAGPRSLRTAEETSFGKKVIQIACGVQHTVILYADNTMRTVGRNQYGQLGNDTTNDSSTLINPGLTNVRQIAAGNNHTLALLSDGSVFAFGYNYFGQLGDGTVSNRLVPVKASVRGVRSIAAGGSHSLFLHDDQTVSAVGYNYFGQLGTNTTDNQQKVVSTTVQNVDKIACGGSHSLFLHTNQQLTVCGFNHNGQLGLGNNNMSVVQPQRISDGITDVFANANNSGMIRDNKLYVTGANDYGQLALGDTNARNQFTFVDVPGIVRAAFGTNHLLVVADSNWAAGRNNAGQLGDGTTIDRTNLVKTFVI